ncbi:hypothetical protein B1218_35580, partial [Pseudomonas ogarae]
GAGDGADERLERAVGGAVPAAVREAVGPGLSKERGDVAADAAAGAGGRWGFSHGGLRVAAGRGG